MSMIFTHNGKITVKNPATGNHRTFQIKTVKKGSLEGKRILSLLSGPDNESDYVGFGFVNDNNVSVWNKFRADSQYAKLGKMLENLDTLMNEGKVEVLFETKCRRCNRTLTTPESVVSGIGPDCASREEF